MKRELFLLALCACTESRDAITGAQSLEVELVSPMNPGDVKIRLPDTSRLVQMNVTAKDAEGNLDTSVNDRTTYPECVAAMSTPCPCKPAGVRNGITSTGERECGPLRVYAQFLGTLSPELSATPLAVVPIVNGAADNILIDLAATPVFGPTTLWFDNGTDFGPDYTHGALGGTSPTLWYRDPFISDLQMPACDAVANPACMALQDPLGAGPLEDKQIRVGASRHNKAGGNRGVLVVTSVFSQGYTVADVQCATGLPNPTPPCTIQPQDNGVSGYDHAMVFTFSAARDQYFRPMVQGEVIESFNGGLSEFNGLTEVGFPRTFLPIDLDQDGNPKAPIVNEALMPTPVNFAMKWFTGLQNPADPDEGMINFERNEAGPVKFTNVTVCALDDGPDGVYSKYKQWSVDPDPAGLCKMGSSNDRARLISLITAGTDFTTDPKTLLGRKLDVVGIVRPVNLPGFNVWIVYPRGKEDIVIK